MRHTSAEIGVDILRAAVHGMQMRVVAAADADINTGARAAEFVRCLARSLQCFPRDFKQQALLRIHALRFTRRDAKKLRIELIDVINEARAARVHFAGRSGIGIVIVLHVPTARGNLRNAIHALAQELPKFFGIVRAIGKT